MWDLLFRFIDGDTIIETDKKVSVEPPSKKDIMIKHKKNYNELEKQATDLISKIEQLQDFLEKFNNKI